jgi:hypothetical protein
MRTLLAATVLSSRLSAGLWLCRNCFEVWLISTTDDAPRYRVQDGTIEETYDIERDAFLCRHLGHLLTPLKKKVDRYLADRPAWDPFRTAYEEVTDGRETFLLKSWRTQLDEPRQYALLRGSLAVETTIQLPDEPLRQELTRAFSCPSRLVEDVVKTLQRMAAALPPDELLPAYCSATDPDVSFFYPNEQHVGILIESCRKEGLGLGKEALHGFFTPRQQEDTLLLELRRHCELRFQ